MDAPSLPTCSTAVSAQSHRRVYAVGIPPPVPENIRAEQRHAFMRIPPKKSDVAENRKTTACTTPDTLLRHATTATPSTQRPPAGRGSGKDAFGQRRKPYKKDPPSRTGGPLVPAPRRVCGQVSASMVGDVPCALDSSMESSARATHNEERNQGCLFRSTYSTLPIAAEGRLTHYIPHAPEHCSVQDNCTSTHTSVQYMAGSGSSQCNGFIYVGSPPTALSTRFEPTKPRRSLSFGRNRNVTPATTATSAQSSTVHLGRTTSLSERPPEVAQEENASGHVSSHFPASRHPQGHKQKRHANQTAQRAMGRRPQRPSPQKVFGKGEHDENQEQCLNAEEGAHRQSIPFYPQAFYPPSDPAKHLSEPPVFSEKHAPGPSEYASTAPIYAVYAHIPQQEQDSASQCRHTMDPPPPSSSPGSIVFSADGSAFPMYWQATGYATLAPPGRSGNTLSMPGAYGGNGHYASLPLYQAPGLGSTCHRQFSGTPHVSQCQPSIRDDCSSNNTKKSLSGYAARPLAIDEHGRPHVHGLVRPPPTDPSEACLGQDHSDATDSSGPEGGNARAEVPPPSRAGYKEQFRDYPERVSHRSTAQEQAIGNPFGSPFMTVYLPPASSGAQHQPHQGAQGNFYVHYSGGLASFSPSTTSVSNTMLQYHAPESVPSLGPQQQESRAPQGFPREQSCVRASPPSPPPPPPPPEMLGSSGTSGSGGFRYRSMQQHPYSECGTQPFKCFPQDAAPLPPVENGFPLQTQSPHFANASGSAPGFPVSYQIPGMPPCGAMGTFGFSGESGPYSTRKAEKRVAVPWSAQEFDSSVVACSKFPDHGSASGGPSHHAFAGTQRGDAIETIWRAPGGKNASSRPIKPMEREAPTTALNSTGYNHLVDRSAPTGQGLHYEEHPAVAQMDSFTVEKIYRELQISVQGTHPPKPIQSFEHAPFPDFIKHELERARYISPYPIQVVGWPVALSGRDMIGIARTGSGKTLAYLLPALLCIQASPFYRKPEGPVVLILAPTRELAMQIDKEARRFCGSAKMRVCCVYGGVPRRSQALDLQRGVHLCIATPGRLIDFLESRVTRVDRVQYLVLDEADRMLDMGFEPQIRQIVFQISPKRQTLMWSATWPREVQKLARDFCRHDPVKVTVGAYTLQANEDIIQKVEVCSAHERFERLVGHLLQLQDAPALNSSSGGNNRTTTDTSGYPFRVRLSMGTKKALIFCETKRGCDYLQDRLQQALPQLRVAAIHGDKDQRERDRILADFKSNRLPVLIATDVASRGLDIKNIDLVLNYDVPKTIEDYIHRIGRTGRAGAVGTAVTLFSDAIGNAERIRMARNICTVMQEVHQAPPPELIAIRNSGGGHHNGGQTPGHRYYSAPPSHSAFGRRRPPLHRRVNGAPPHQPASQSQWMAPPWGRGKPSSQYLGGAGPRQRGGRGGVDDHDDVPGSHRNGFLPMMVNSAAPDKRRNGHTFSGSARGGSVLQGGEPGRRHIMPPPPPSKSRTDRQQQTSSYPTQQAPALSS